jgi:hypothetical protein
MRTKRRFVETSRLSTGDLVKKACILRVSLRAHMWYQDLRAKVMGHIDWKPREEKRVRSIAERAIRDETAGIIRPIWA